MSEQQPPNQNPPQQPTGQAQYGQQPFSQPQNPQQPFPQPQQPWRQPPAGQGPPNPTPHKTRSIVVASAVGVVILIGAIGGAFSDGGAAEQAPNDNAQPVAVSSPPPDNGPTPDPITTPKSQPSQPKPTTAAPKPTRTAPAPKPKPKPVVYKKLTAREWAKLVKSPDDHIGETILVYGVVTQFDAATGENGFRADTDARRRSESYEYSENTVFQQVEGAGTLDDVVEGDFFTAKVKVLGSYSYDTQIGGNTTVPSFEVVSISVTGHGN